MMITRRVLIGSSIALGSVYGLTAHANELATPINESPLFSIQDKIAYVLTANRTPASMIGMVNHVMVSISKEQFADAVPVESVVAAEDRVFAAARDMHLDEIADMIDAKRPYHLNQLLKQRRDPSALPFNIIRASNRIGRVSRRGFGNHVLMHPEMFARLRRINSPAFVTPVAPTTIGRWTKVAMYTKSIHLLIGEALPPNQIVAFYRNPAINVVDGPVMVVKDATDDLAMTTYPDKIFRFSIPRQALV